MELIIAIGIGTLFGVSVYQILQRNVIRSAIGIILLGSAINLFLLSAGSVNGEVPAYDIAEFAASARPDALPQALVLTAIVISMGGLTLILAMLYIVAARYKTSDLGELNNLRN